MIRLFQAFLAALFSTAVLYATPASAQQAAALSVVNPVRDCATLAQVNLSAATGTQIDLAAKVVDTAKGQFCQVTGTIARAIGFEVDLPVARWTQRFLQAGCGGLCGSINASIGQAGGCRPATEGEFVVAASDLGHQGQMGSPTEGDFAADPQKRIDFAYRANHLTSLAAKALIRAFYGQAQRYAYFSGCSDGGREALMEAQRYPDDFDGISAGAPAMLFQVQNSFWHAWTTAANRRPDGGRILAANKLPVLHAAVLAHCDALDGVKDGLVSDPRACRPDQSWSACALSASDTSACLTADEWAAALRLYQGPTDAAGHRFVPGGAQPGSELQWSFGGGGPPPGAVMVAGSMRPVDLLSSGGPRGGPGKPGGAAGGMVANMAKVVYRDPTPAEVDATRFPFTTAQFERVSVLHPLNDATDPDLSAFARHGGRLIMYHGWSDTSIAPMISIAYRQAVERTMGAASADRVLRLFMIPGMGHCGGGDGFPQIDTLTPLMAWVEGDRVPQVIMADRVDNDGASSGGPDGRGGGPGMVRAPAPYAPVARPALASRPIYAYPAVARFNGNGDPMTATSYAPATTPDPALVWYGERLLQPRFQRFYRVENGALATP